MAVMSCRGCGSVFKSESLAQAGVLFDQHECDAHPFVAGQIDRRFSDAASDTGDQIWMSTTKPDRMPWGLLVATLVILISAITVFVLGISSGGSH